MNKFFIFVIAIAIVFISACATKPPMQLTEVQQKATLGMSTADVLATIGLPDASYHLFANNRVLIYNQAGLYFVEDQLTHIFDVKASHSLNVVKSEGQLLKCDSFLFESGSAENKAEILKQIKLNIAAKAMANTCKISLQTQMADGADLKDLQSLPSGLEYNPTYYESKKLPKTYNFSAGLIPSAKLVISVKQNNQQVWSAQVQSYSNSTDEKQNNQTLLLGAAWVFGQNSNGAIYDVVYANDARLSGSFVRPDLALRNKIIFSDETKKVIKPFQAFAFLGDEALFTESVRKQVDLTGYSTDTNALCLALRSGFSAGLEEVLKAGVDSQQAIKDHRPGRMYISAKSCTEFLDDKNKAAQMQALIKAVDAVEEKKQAALPSGVESAAPSTTESASGDATKPKKSLVNWDEVVEFLKPQAPGQNNNQNNQK